MDQYGPPPEGPRYKLVFAKSFWHWGLMRRLRAKDYGLEAFPLKVRVDRPRRIPPDRIASIKAPKTKRVKR